MRLSTTDIYAFQSLAYLGTQPLGNWVGSDTISEVTGIHRPYLVRILATLSSNDIIASKKGIGGGYALSKAAKDINLRDVMRAIDGPVAPLSCVSLKWGKECPEQDRCHARNHIWLRVRDAMLAALAEVTVKDLATDFQRGITYRLCLEHLLSPQA